MNGDSFDLISTYFPAPSELTAAQLQAGRKAAATWLAAAYPDLDTRPDSVFGNFMLSPFALLLSGLEEAMRRFRSDVTLGRAGAGVIYDCDFVKEFLENFGAGDRYIRQASGMLRLAFTEDADVTIDRGTKFSVDGSDTEVFMLRLANEGPLEILAVGSTLASGINQVALQQVGESQYVADVPVLGYVEDELLEGTSLSIDRDISNLSAATALYDFVKGSPPASLVARAQAVRETVYAMGLASRGQAVQFVKQFFPEVIGVSAVMVGDTEMMRGGVNPIGIQQGAMDLFVKSADWAFADTMRVRLPYIEEIDGHTVQRFLGKLNLAHVPIALDSVVCTGTPDVTLAPGSAQGARIWGRSLDSARAPLGTAAYSPLQEFWLDVAMPFDETTGLPLIGLLVNDSGESYADFDLTYWTDPLIRTVHDYINSTENQPANCDVLVRGFVPIVLNQFEIHYVRQPGVLMQFADARKQIATYLNTLCYPKGFSIAEIGESMKSAGAAYVRDVKVRGSLRHSFAHIMLPDDADDLDVDYAAAEAAGLSPYVVTIADIHALFPTYRDHLAGTENEQLVSVGPRNVTLRIEESLVTFYEET